VNGVDCFATITPKKPSLRMARIESGSRIADRYLLQERIGDGGHGEIWAAWDTHSEKRIALKFLHPHSCGTGDAMAVLQHEAEMSGRLDHPGVLLVGLPFIDDRCVFLPMEFAAGGDLKSLRGDSWRRCVPVLIRVAEVLAHAHERGVVHRDIKPGNVLFDDSGGLRLADWGTAACAGSKQGFAMGSPFSASPQQLRGNPATPSDDIYGLGALAYELLGGYPPYYPDFDELRSQHEMPADLRPRQPAPPRLVALIMSMLARETADRPANMRQVVDALQLALSDTSSLPPAPAALIAERVEVIAAPTRRFGLQEAAMIVGVIAAAAILFAIGQHAPARKVAIAAPPVAAPAAVPIEIPEASEAEAVLLAKAAREQHELAALLAAGDKHLSAGQAALARTAFADALRLQPDNALARRGLDAVARLESVLQAHTSAIQLEAAGDQQGALENYAAALKLDARFGPALEGQARVTLALQDGKFAAALVESRRAMSAGRFEQARKAVDRAAMLGRGPVIAELRNEIDRGERIALNQRDATAGLELERQERWAEAVSLYQSAHARDAGQAMQQALQRSQERMAFAAQLDDYTSRPDRLLGPQVRQSAERAVQRSQRYARPAPVMDAQVARLVALLKTLSVEAHVEISSDNNTRVSIASVGELGAFTSRELTLPPGRYVVTGTRAGYRDVRHELAIMPGLRVVSVSVQCTERI
jgi:tetratricopeptide (TPR) repeat protein